MRVFVTGATGFIGRHLVRRLAAEGHSVRCLVRPASDRAGLDELGVALVEGDICRAETVVAGVRGCDWVLHLAGLYSVWERDASRFARVNVEGTRNVMASALEAGVARVIHVSTVAVYGRPAEVPFREDSRPGPELFSRYARTKAEGDRIAWALHRERGLPLTALYPGIVLGAGDRKASGQYIRDFIRGLTPSTIYQKSPAVYVYVQDVVTAILLAAADEASIGEKYLVGGERLSGMDYARRISRLSGRGMPPFNFPDWMVTGAAAAQTWLADRVGVRPLWGLSRDAARMLQAGFDFDGSKIQRRLGLGYTPIEVALAEEIDYWRKRTAPVKRPAREIERDVT